MPEAILPRLERLKGLIETSEPAIQVSTIEHVVLELLGIIADHERRLIALTPSREYPRVRPRAEIREIRDHLLTSTAERLSDMRRTDPFVSKPRELWRECQVTPWGPGLEEILRTVYLLGWTEALEKVIDYINEQHTESS